MKTLNKLNLFLKNSSTKYKNEFVVKIDPDFCLKLSQNRHRIRITNDDRQLSVRSDGFKTLEDSLFAMNIMILISMVLSFSDMLWYF
ncbi:MULTISPECIES: hypothetical protein [Leptospira]|uniref:Uncharacterized protein n=1 Tax=Leptospira santarosai TaxID=28183 RepID=A0A2P1QTX6_9LEPT|nr:MULTISPECIES: hypothetical protein [Leptospira]AVQ12349.1 Uncharacterized protein XB16_2022 [Leptospira santarosai]EKO79530.1 hypothetical protein LEP1GSC068_0957 [Leptospira sp. Fiocruz LV3954]EMI69895.1 hypothetical protein LEP1GSC076_0572 [Leptospira sp. Fiocruz LV4135]MDI7225937.1 hypothetical protein [Leptospira santarosai]MDI7229289.1 hypothetical protein [Leptospira santarosai]